MSAPIEKIAHEEFKRLVQLLQESKSNGFFYKDIGGSCSTTHAIGTDRVGMSVAYGYGLQIGIEKYNEPICINSYDILFSTGKVKGESLEHKEFIFVDNNIFWKSNNETFTTNELYKYIIKNLSALHDEHCLKYPNWDIQKMIMTRR